MVAFFPARSCAHFLPQIVFPFVPGPTLLKVHDLTWVCCDLTPPENVSVAEAHQRIGFLLQHVVPELLEETTRLHNLNIAVVDVHLDNFVRNSKTRRVSCVDLGFAQRTSSEALKNEDYGGVAKCLVMLVAGQTPGWYARFWALVKSHGAAILPLGIYTAIVQSFYDIGDGSLDRVRGIATIQHLLSSFQAMSAPETLEHLQALRPTVNFNPNPVKMNGADDEFLRGKFAPQGKRALVQRFSALS